MDAYAPRPVYPAPRPASFWVAIVLAVLLAISMLVSMVCIGVAIGGKAETRPFDEEYVLGDKTSEDKILDIALTGTISDVDVGRGQNVVHTIVAELRQARNDDHIKGVLIEMNTPGGGITASDVLYHEVDQFRKDRKIPVVVLCKDVTASGGYYVAMATDHIIAHPTSIVGSIGVIAQLTNLQGLMQKVGVQMNVIKSQRPDGSESFKDIGSPYREMKPAERAMMQSMIQKMWSRFVEVVESGRKGKLTRAQIEDLADGRVWTGREALELKLVDGIGYQEDAWKKAAELAHAGGARLVRYKSKSTLLGDLFGVRSDAPDVNALLERTLDPGATSSPQFMYLWSVR